jgi:WD40 repeat protein
MLRIEKKIMPPTGVKLVGTLRGHAAPIGRIAWSPDGKTLATTSEDNTARLWDVDSLKMIRVLEGHREWVVGVAFEPSTGERLATASYDKTIRLWETTSGRPIHLLAGHIDRVLQISWSPQGAFLASGGADRSIRLWEPSTGKQVVHHFGHYAGINDLRWSRDETNLISGSYDRWIRSWNVAGGHLGWDALRWQREVHTAPISCLTSSPDGTLIASGAEDRNIEISTWESGEHRIVLEGHNAEVTGLDFSPDGRVLASRDKDGKVWLRNCSGWQVLAVFDEPAEGGWWPAGVAFHPREPVLAIVGADPNGDGNPVVNLWELDLAHLLGQSIAPTVTYTSAKVVLVGESNVGKSYLAHRIAMGKPPDEGAIRSTHGMKFWPLPPERLCAEIKAPADQRRDVVLWDMGGQEEYRLVHQLFLHDTTVALLLFDPTRGATAFKEVETWNKYLVKQLHERKAVKLLVGAKLDEATDTVDDQAIEQLRSDGGFAGFFKTSAITGCGVAALCVAVAKGIDWEGLGTTSRPVLFQRIRDEIEVQRKRGEVVLHVLDLHRALGDEAGTEHGRQAIRTVVDQLAAQGVIACSRMATGEHALVLQVQEIERYAGSLILAARKNPRGVPALEIRAITKPDFTLPGIPEKERLKRTQEKAVLECTVELLLEHGICFEHEGLLVFPTLFAPASEADNEKLPHSVSLYYDFSGAIDNIYASLVAWLVLAKDFGRLRLAPARAEFEATDGGLCGLRKVARPGGFAHVDVYFEDKTPSSRRDEFISFVENHLKKHGVELCERLVVDCPKGFVFDDETLRMSIAEGDREVICPRCKIQHRLNEGAAEVRKRDSEILDRLWALRTQIEESRKDATREAVRVLASASAVEPALRPLRLLHLSDLHFDAATPVSARLQWLLDDLKRDEGLQFKELDYLVVSGDFTDKASADGFEKAYVFLSELAKTFALSAERCILVPGNHDVAEPLDAYTRRKDSKGLRDGEWVQQGALVMARDPEKYPIRFKPFSDNLYHKFVQRPYPMPVAEQGIAIPFWETGIQFLTLNSCWEIDEFDRKRAGIHPEAVAHAIKQAQQQVEDARKSGQLSPDKEPLRIAVWHHAVTAPDYKMKDLQFLGNLQKNGVKLALHGDVHEMRRDVIGYWHDKALHVTGAGSFGARAGDKAESIPRLYNVLEIERDFSAITVHTRRQRTPDGDWDGYSEWPNPKDRNSRVAYYTINLPKDKVP